MTFFDLKNFVNVCLGNTMHDLETKTHMNELLDRITTNLNVQDGEFVENYSKNLWPEFETHFKNMSLIMDCVGCDKCKLWGKLQLSGLGRDELRIRHEKFLKANFLCHFHAISRMF